MPPAGRQHSAWKLLLLLPPWRLQAAARAAAAGWKLQLVTSAKQTSVSWLLLLKSPAVFDPPTPSRTVAAQSCGLLLLLLLLPPVLADPNTAPGLSTAAAVQAPTASTAIKLLARASVI
jgi:hypothetical protein